MKLFFVRRTMYALLCAPKAFPAQTRACSPLPGARRGSCCAWLPKTVCGRLAQSSCREENGSGLRNLPPWKNGFTVPEAGSGIIRAPVLPYMPPKTGMTRRRLSRRPSAAWFGRKVCATATSPSLPAPRSRISAFWMRRWNGGKFLISWTVRKQSTRNR